jgi:hypothetical protein
VRWPAGIPQRPAESSGVVIVSGVGGLSSGEVVLGDVARQGWWLVVEADGGERVLSGPFADRSEAGWAAGAHELDTLEEAWPVYGVVQGDGTLARRPSPQDWAWLAHLGEQLDRLPEDWDDTLSDEDPLTTLVVEVTAALAEAGLPLHDVSGPGCEVGGACLTPEPSRNGVVVSWRQHDRTSVDLVQGAAADSAVQLIMNRALAEVLTVRGFEVEPVGGGSGHVVR